jgi:hypothetical protein
MSPLEALNEKINATRLVLDNIKTTEDYIKNDLNENRSEISGIRAIFGSLRGGSETHTACVNMRNFLDRFGIVTEEVSHSRYVIKPRIKGVEAFESKPWYAELCLLLEDGYCITKKEYKYPIFDACDKLSVTVSFRNYFGLDYFVICEEYDSYYMNRHKCISYFLEKAKEELSEYSQDFTWKTPKPGLFKQWADAAFRYERLRQMRDEMYHRHSDFDDNVKIYVGTVGGYGYGVTKTENPHTYISNVNFDVEYTSSAYSGSDDTVILNITHELGIEWFVNDYYDVERHKRYDEGKDTTLRAYVDNINVIRRLEWVVP